MDMVEAGVQASRPRLEKEKERGSCFQVWGSSWPALYKSRGRGPGLLPEWLVPEEAGPNLTPATSQPDSDGGGRELLLPHSPLQCFPQKPLLSSPLKETLERVTCSKNRTLP